MGRSPRTTDIKGRHRRNIEAHVPFLGCYPFSFKGSRKGAQGNGNSKTIHLGILHSQCRPNKNVAQLPNRDVTKKGKIRECDAFSVRE